MFFGPPRSIVDTTFSLPVSITERVSSRRLATYKRLPSGESAIPRGLWPTSILDETYSADAERSLANGCRRVRRVLRRRDTSMTVTLCAPAVVRKILVLSGVNATPQGNA